MTPEPYSLRMLSPDDPLAEALPDLVRFSYESDFHYEVEARETPAGFAWSLVRRPVSPPARVERRWQPFVSGSRAPRGYVAFEGETPVGYAESCLDEASNLMRLSLLCVREGKRRAGVGRALLESVEQAARHFRARGVCVEVGSSNVPAIDFFRRFGYTFWGLHSAAFANRGAEGGDALIWMGRAF